MVKKESSVKYVSDLMDNTKDAIETGNYGQIYQYYEQLKAVQLALGTDGQVKQFEQAMKYLEHIKSGNYSMVEQTSSLLEKSKQEVLQKVSTATQRDATLTGRLNPSSVKRKILTELGEKAIGGQYGLPSYSK